MVRTLKECSNGDSFAGIYLSIWANVEAKYRDVDPDRFSAGDVVGFLAQRTYPLKDPDKAMQMFQDRER